MGHFNFLYVLVAFGFITSSGIYIFSRGFLLTRSARTEKRNCDKFYLNIDGKYCVSDDKKKCSSNDDDFLDVTKNISFNADKICFERKSKVVVLLVDALKYEFGLLDKNLKDPLPYQNKLPILDELRRRHPDQTRILKFIADPPTTTLQRLKGITTGSLPTFIDMGSNFATPEINEDNLLDQIVLNNLTAIFMGDSTWNSLFPNRFKRLYPFPSFNIHDLDTVDNAIMKHLPEELKKNDWDIIIAHFLGIDHCGHKYGPLHNEMSRKLTEMNQIIKTISENIDDDTLLLVIGDHGMTLTGDHGGASDDEINALLFAYMKGKKFMSSVYDENVDFMQQIDLTPTLSTILGIPIPFSNLGTLKIQLIPDIAYDSMANHQLLSLHLWHNAQQIRNYFTTYSQDNERIFSFDDLNHFDTNFEILEYRINTVFSEQAFLSLAKDLRSSLTSILQTCRNVWIKFNPQMMTQGMLITFLGIFVAFILVYNIPSQDFNHILNKNVITMQLLLSIGTGFVGYTLHNHFGWDDQLIGFLFMSSLCNILFFGYFIIQNWANIVDVMSTTKKLVNVVPRISFAFSIAVFFSNSFIVQEQRILCYLLSAQIIYGVAEIKRIIPISAGLKMRLGVIMKSTFLKITVAMITSILLLRISHNYFKCREEQGDCWDFTNTAESMNKKEGNLAIGPVIILAIFVTLVRSFLKANGNLTGHTLHVLIMKFLPTISLIAACIYLVLSQKQQTKQIVSYLHLDKLAWIVFGSFLIEIIVIIFNPLLIYLLPRNDDKFSLSNYNNIIPELFRHIKNVFNDNSKSSKTQIPIIYGLATVYSSVFIAFGTLLCIMLSLLLGVEICNGFIIVLIVGFIVLFIFSILRFESATDINDCLQPNFSLIVTWYLLYSYGFYSTSHQPTISQIDWNAAFVGRTANFDNSNIISAILVLLSTFNSNFILLILYPLIIIFPFMIYSIWPNLSVRTFADDKKNKDEISSEYKRITLNDSENEESTSVKNVSRGEINLYENENLFISSSFKVGCQLIILQGTKSLASMIACTILCRHLMVWKVFAPRFIYEGIASYISFIAIIVGFMLLMRVHKSVKSLVHKVNKIC